MTDNLKGATLMVLAMAGFALEDMFIKLTAGTVGVWGVIFLLGLGGGLIFALCARAKGVSLTGRHFWHRAVLSRNVFEAIATVCFVTALAQVDLSLLTAILQATPLVVTMGAALFMGAQVGWRRWSAILVGLLGVLIILRPGMAGFEPLAIYAVLATLFLAFRDLATRVVPGEVHTFALATWAFATLALTGGVALLVTGAPLIVSPGDGLLLSCALLAGLAAYYGIIEAMRIGEVAVVTPFRYTRLLFALVLAVVVFSERPDATTLFGAGLILASGLYTLWREAKSTV